MACTGLTQNFELIILVELYAAIYGMVHYNTIFLAPRLFSMNSSLKR